MKKNVLVFPCGSEIGLEIYRSLNFSTHFKLYGGSSIDDHGRFAYDNYIGDIPLVDSPGFITKLNEIIVEKNIDFIIPAHDSVVLKLAQAKAKGDLKCEVLTSPVETCEVARSKARTYEVFREILRTPRLYQADEVKDSDLPVFLKPDVGQGSKGVHLAKKRAEIETYLSRDPSLLILEYLPGKEYTIDCFTDRQGQLSFCEGRERRRIMNGISVNTFSVDDERFGMIGRQINRALKFRGAWFFQVKETVSGELALMEIAPRIAGTMALARCKGVNLVLLGLFDALGYDVEIFKNDYRLVLDRALSNSYHLDQAYKHVYLDFDDLVIFDGKVNPEVMAFVFQCMNKGIKVHLLTRHKQDLETSLRKYKLSGLFDELLWVKDGEEKSDYIKERQAILIDDSFAERQKVHQKIGIPVFDAHMIEALMEKF